MNNKLVKISVIAAHFGISQQTVRRWESEGYIESYRAGKKSHRRYDIEEVKRRIKERMKNEHSNDV